MVRPGMPTGGRPTAIPSFSVRLSVANTASKTHPVRIALIRLA
jgi:hypothetical protein